VNLLKTSFLNGIAVAVKVASALVLNKILAVYVGPAGYAVIGQFQNAVSIIVSLAGGVMATGVTKATAQHFDDEAKQHAVWQTAIRVSLVASIVAALPLLLLSNSLAQWVLHRSDLSNVFVWLAITLPAMAANNLLLAIVNGKKEVGIFVTANIIGSLISLLVIGVLALEFGLYGTLIAFAINPAIVIFATATLVAKRDWFKAKFIWGQMNRTALSELSGFALMGLTSALAMPITFILIRDHLATNIGLAAAGYWQASFKISEIYLMLVTTTLSAYYLPRLSEIRTAPELKAEISKVYRFVMPVVILGAVSIYFMRDFIIATLFTKDFLPLRDLFPWQLTGDVIKIGSWILAFVMIGRGMVKVYVLSEIFFSISFVMLGRIYVEFFGLKGMSMAYATNYIIYWFGTWYLVNIEMQRMNKTYLDDQGKDNAE
jgi:PST family polysaccharide transporter